MTEEQELFDLVVRRNIFILSSLAVKQSGISHSMAFAKQVAHLRNLYCAHREWFRAIHVDRIRMLKQRFMGELPQSPRITEEDTQRKIEHVLRFRYPAYANVHEFLNRQYKWLSEQLPNRAERDFAIDPSEEEEQEKEIRWINDEYSSWAFRLPPY